MIGIRIEHGEQKESQNRRIHRIIEDKKERKHSILGISEQSSEWNASKANNNRNAFPKLLPKAASQSATSTKQIWVEDLIEEHATDRRHGNRVLNEREVYNRGENDATERWHVSSFGEHRMQPENAHLVLVVHATRVQWVAVGVKVDEAEQSAGHYQNGVEDDCERDFGDEEEARFGFGVGRFRAHVVGQEDAEFRTPWQRQ